MEKTSVIFAQTRRRKKISLKKAAKETKIPRHYLEAIEKDNHLLFPSFDYGQLYVRDYAQYLGLSPWRMVKFFCRDWQGEEKSPRPVSREKFGLKPPLFNISSLPVSLLIFIIAIYLFYQYRLFNSPPPLKVNLFCFADKLVVEGKTSREATVEVEGKNILVNFQGEFREEISPPWPAEIKVVTQSPTGKISKEDLKADCF